MPIRKFEWNPFTLEGEAPASLRFNFVKQQSNWKFFQDDAAEPTIQLVDENVRPTLVNFDIIRCRVPVLTYGGTGIVSMQYSTDDVNFSDFAFDADWNYADGQATEGNQVTTFKISNSTVYGHYYESGTLSKYFDAGYQEVDFAIQLVGATYNTTYYFRFLWEGIEINLGPEKTHPQVSTPVAPTKLMRHLKWFYDGVFKGCWLGRD